MAERKRFAANTSDTENEVDRPRKKQRTSEPLSQPSRRQPSRRAKQVESTAVSQPKPPSKSIPLPKVTLPVESPEPEKPAKNIKIILHVLDREVDLKLALHLNSILFLKGADSLPTNDLAFPIRASGHVYTPWQHLPFAEPKSIKLQLVLSTNGGMTDIVFYTPQLITGKVVAPWNQSTHVYLHRPREAAVITVPGLIKGEQVQVVLFGQDMQAALAQKGHFADAGVLELGMWPHEWNTSLSKELEGLPSRIVIQKNGFDGSYQRGTIRSFANLEVCRLRHLVDTAKLGFMRRSGLSKSDVEDIFQHRTEIKFILDDAGAVTQDDQMDLQSRWAAEVEFPEHRIKIITLLDAHTFWAGSNMTKSQVEAHLEHPADALSTAAGSHEYNVLVLDIGYFHAKASVMRTFVTTGQCTVPTMREVCSNSHGCYQLRPLMAFMLQQAYMWEILETSFTTAMTYEAILESMVDSFEVGLNLFGGDVGLCVFFPEGIHPNTPRAAAYNGQSYIVMSPSSVIAIINEWLAPLVAMLAREFRSLGPAEADGHQHERRPPQTLLTCSWIQNRYMIRALVAALRNAGIPQSMIVTSQDVPTPESGAMGALWSME